MGSFFFMVASCIFQSSAKGKQLLGFYCWLSRKHSRAVWFILNLKYEELPWFEREGGRWFYVSNESQLHSFFFLRTNRHEFLSRLSFFLYGSREVSIFSGALLRILPLLGPWDFSLRTVHLKRYFMANLWIIILINASH